jgi:hypothetical protein
MNMMNEGLPLIQDIYFSTIAKQLPATYTPNEYVFNISFKYDLMNVCV